MATWNDRSMSYVRSVQDKYRDLLLSKSHVIGVSSGKTEPNSDELALVVLVDKDVPNARRSARDQIPEELEGVQVVTRNVGKIAAQ